MSVDTPLRASSTHTEIVEVQCSCSASRETSASLSFRGHPFWKRTFDIFASCALLVAALPVLLIASLVIRIGSRGPVFFRQTRVGAMGRPFRIWKLRTMKGGTDQSRHKNYVRELCRSNGALQKLDIREELIPCGGILRDLGIDELPQLINVLAGEMSLVGPRPDVIPLDDYPADHRVRFEVVPGITGLWQVGGKNKTTFEEMMVLDADYVTRRSLLLDLQILLSTPISVASPAINMFRMRPSLRRRSSYVAGMSKTGPAAKV